MPLFETITDLAAGQDALARRRYGVIEARGGRVVGVHLRPFPKLLAWPDFWPVGKRYHARGTADRCLLYYNQPLRFSNFIALRYIVSTPATRYATFRASVLVLDQIARLKRTDALLCDIAGSRISERLMSRFGWEPHKPQRWHRNYIKRFYGKYPAPAAACHASTARDEAGE